MTDNNKRQIVTPGEKVIEGSEYLPGEGTEKKDNAIVALRFGLSEIQNKLVKVIPLSGVYEARRGNVVIGKVENVMFNGWQIDIGAADLAFLSLAEVPKYINQNEIEDFMSIGDMVVVKIWGINKRGIDLSLKSRGLGKIDDGLIIRINPHKVPRVIGKEGSMVTLIKEKTGCNITVGQNGTIWIKGNDVDSELLAKAAIQFVVDKSYISGLTEEVEKWFKENGNSKEDSKKKSEEEK